MGRDDYSQWDRALVAPLSATVPPDMGGLRLDQALARLSTSTRATACRNGCERATLPWMGAPRERARR